MNLPGKWYRALYVQVLIAVLIGVLCGHFLPDLATQMKPLGDAFVKLIKMMIAPVVFCTIVIGVAGMEDSRQLGKTALKAIVLFQVLMVLALACGLVGVTILKPGVGMNVNPATLDASSVSGFVHTASHITVAEFLLRIIPASYVGAFANGEVLPVLLLAVLTGFALSRSGKAGQPFLDVVEAFSKITFTIFGYLMKLAPLGAFGAIAFTVGRYGFGSLGSLAKLVAVFYVSALFFVIVILGAISRLHGFSIWRLLRYFREELLIVLGTSSSEPVLPRMLEKLETLGCRKSVVGLVLPMGYSFNLSGTAIYLTLATLFIAQACNIHLSIGQIAALLGVMLLSSKGAAGVTGSGFVALVATLTVIPDVPVAGIALIVGIDRFMSEARALTSVISNAVATIVVAKWEGKCDFAMLERELAHPTSANQWVSAEALNNEPQRSAPSVSMVSAERKATVR
jgi:aerobic C4-dicarboxylate transport protein